MATKKRPRRSIATAPNRAIGRAAQSASRPPRSESAAWKWRTFPVFAALVTGMLIAFIVNEGSVNPVAFVLQLAAVLGVGYCLAHFVVTQVVVGGRMRRRAAATERGEAADEDLEDVVVYPDDPVQH